MSSRRARSKGFTLMEMLVVIAIISTLAGLLLSGVMVARKRSIRHRCSMLLTRIATAIESYELDFGDYPSEELILRIAGAGFMGTKNRKSSTRSSRPT